MRNVRISVLIGQSCRRTAEILFKPFSLKKWLRLLLIALLAGALAGGGNSGGGNSKTQTREQPGKEQVASQSNVSQAQSGAAQSKVHAGPTLPPNLPVLLLAIGGIILALLIIFLLIMMWLGARFRFVWVNSVVNNSSAIIEPYSRHAQEANSIFKFSIVMLLIFLITIAMIGTWIFLSMKASGAFESGFVWSLSAGLKIFLMPAIVFLVYLIIFGFIGVVTDQFVVPMMAFDKIRVVPAFRAFGKIFAGNWPDILLFLLVELLLGILTAILRGAFYIVGAIFLVLVAVVVFGIPFVILWLGLKAQLIFIGYAIILGIPFLVFAIIALMALQLPFAVFFRAFTINYLVSLNCGYSQDTLNEYAARKAERISAKTPVVLMVLAVFIIGAFFIIGLLAAIAIPNFIKARGSAISAKKAAITQSANIPTPRQP